MKKLQKSDKISIFAYALLFVWSLLYFWVLAGPTGLLDMLVWQYILLFVLCPSIILIVHTAKNGMGIKSFALILVFWFLNSLNFWLTWNILWFVNSKDPGSLLGEIGTVGHLTIPASLVGILMGIIIRAIVKRFKKAKAEQE